MTTALLTAGSIAAFLLGMLVERIFLYRTDFSREADELKFKNVIQQAVTIELEQKKAKAEAEIAKTKLEQTKNWIGVTLRFQTKAAAARAWNRFELFFANNKSKYEQSDDSKLYYDDNVNVCYVFERYRIIDPTYFEKPIDFNAMLGDLGDKML